MSRQANSQDYDWLVKVIVIGDSGVGKTNILSQFCDAKFSITHMATLGVDFKIKTIDVDGKKLKLQIWDTAGQERFRNITKTYYKGAQGVILSYSVIDRQSFQNVDGWLRSIQENTNSSDVQLVLVGNKADMSAERQVTLEEGKKLSQQFNIPFFETSAKSNLNINETFHNLAQRIIQTLSKMQANDDKQNLNLKTPQPKDKPKNESCC
ncbi:unnamed protein product [Paramecium pentaurelia]|uniref:Ras-related protein Rab-1 n=1 Tax=Paramecium pentaurelia TaxID=43138 RepID=A0A8S1W4T3_9CILI|nr:unnamed protein product [Paramecium pentaurelia]